MPEQQSTIPGKRIIVCCNGTWSDSVSTDSPLTNVARISRFIPAVDSLGVAQLVSYYADVGSSTSIVGNTIDGVTGRGQSPLSYSVYVSFILQSSYLSLWLLGVSANIRVAYTFICHNYLPQDEIILIRVSRGAFTVRAVASLIADVGLLKKAGLGSMLKLYNMWKEQAATPNNAKGRTHGTRDLCHSLESAELLQTGIKLKACAVWDTVGSLAFPKKLAFVNSNLPKNIEVAVQALALDERRKHFPPTVWQSNGTIKLEQCWFLGAHSDVGGGNENTQLPNIALILTFSQLSKCVSFDETYLLKATSNEDLELHGRTQNITTSLFFGSRSLLEDITTTDQESTMPVTKSLKGIFVLSGSQPRNPGQTLMTQTGLQRISKMTSGQVATDENIHWTVRVLIGIGSHLCPTLRKYAAEFEHGQWVWNLYSQNKIKIAIQLKKSEF